MSRDEYEAIRREAERARADAEVRREAAVRRAAEIEAYLAQLRDGDPHHPALDREAKRHAGEAEAGAQGSRERDRRGHERAARAHDRAAAQHDRAAATYEAYGQAARAEQERLGGGRERDSAEHDRRAAERSS